VQYYGVLVWHCTYQERTETYSLQCLSCNVMEVVFYYFIFIKRRKRRRYHDKKEKRRAFSDTWTLLVSCHHLTKCYGVMLQNIVLPIFVCCDLTEDFCAHEDCAVMLK